MSKKMDSLDKSMTILGTSLIGLVAVIIICSTLVEIIGGSCG